MLPSFRLSFIEPLRCSVAFRKESGDVWGRGLCWFCCERILEWGRVSEGDRGFSEFFIEFRSLGCGYPNIEEVSAILWLYSLYRLYRCNGLPIPRQFSLG